MNPYYIALWIMFFVACVGMYAAFRWGYEMACQHNLDMIDKGEILVNEVAMSAGLKREMSAEHYDRAMKAINQGTRINPVPMPSPGNGKPKP